MLLLHLLILNIIYGTVMMSCFPFRLDRFLKPHPTVVCYRNPCQKYRTPLKILSSVRLCNFKKGFTASKDSTIVPPCGLAKNWRAIFWVLLVIQFFKFLFKRNFWTTKKVVRTVPTIDVPEWITSFNCLKMFRLKTFIIGSSYINFVGSIRIPLYWWYIFTHF